MNNKSIIQAKNVLLNYYQKAVRSENHFTVPVDSGKYTLQLLYFNNNYSPLGSRQLLQFLVVLVFQNIYPKTLPTTQNYLQV